MSAHEKASAILAISGNASFTNQIFVSVKKSDDCAGIRKAIQSKDGDHVFTKIMLSLATLGFFGDLELPVLETLEIPFKGLPINLQKIAEDAHHAGIKGVGFDDGPETIIKYTLEHEASLEKPNEAIKLITQFLDNYNNYNTQASSLSEIDKSRQVLRYNLAPSDLRDLFIQEFARCMTDPLLPADKLAAICPKEVQSLVIARSKFMRNGGLLEVWNKAIQKAEDAKVAGRPILRVFQSVEADKISQSTTSNRNPTGSATPTQTCPLWARNPTQRGLCDGSCGLAHSFRDSAHYGRMLRATGITHSENIKKQVLASHLRVKTKVKNMKTIVKNSNAMKKGGKGNNNNNRVSSAAANGPSQTLQHQNPLQQQHFGFGAGMGNGWALSDWGANPQLQQQYSPYNLFSGGGAPSSSSSKGNGNASAKAAGNQISHR